MAYQDYWQRSLALWKAERSLPSSARNVRTINVFEILVGTIREQEKEIAQLRSQYVELAKRRAKREYEARETPAVPPRVCALSECGRTFHPLANHPDYRYCCNAHRNKAYRKRKREKANAAT
jgi:hypothetical protein